MEEPSSDVRESVTLESGNRQKGQNILDSLLDVDCFSILTTTAWV
jgi:hypothetical protein